MPGDGDSPSPHRHHASPGPRETRRPLVTQSNISRRAANCSVTAVVHDRSVTAALKIAADEALAAGDGAGPVRRSRAERQAIVLDTAERLFAGRSSRSVGMDELVRETGLGQDDGLPALQEQGRPGRRLPLPQGRDGAGVHRRRARAPRRATRAPRCSRSSTPSSGTSPAPASAAARSTTSAASTTTRSTPPAARPPTTSSSCTSGSSAWPTRSCPATARTSPPRST